MNNEPPTNSHEATLNIRNTLTPDGLALVQVNIDGHILNLDPSAGIQFALTLLGACYSSRAEEAIYKATHEEEDTLKRAIKHMRIIK